MPTENFTGGDVVDGRAWRAFCERLARVGERILGDDFPSSPRGRTEGYRHLANQTIGWMSWALFYADTTQPALYRQNDLVVRWGGPNVDQVTRRARLAPEGVYRIHGHMGACEDFILTLKDGDMYMDKYGILSECTAGELGIRSGEEFELIISAEEQPGRWIPLPPNAMMMNFREYYFDWRALPPAVISIQRLDTVGVPPPLITAEQFAAQLDDAATLIERSVVYWNDWVNGERGEGRNEHPLRASRHHRRLEEDRIRVRLLRPCGRRSVGHRDRHSRRGLLRLSALQPRLVRDARFPQPDNKPQPHPDHTERRRSAAYRCFASRPRSSQLDRHHGLPRSDVHLPLDQAPNHPDGHCPRDTDGRSAQPSARGHPTR